MTATELIKKYNITLSPNGDDTVVIRNTALAKADNIIDDVIANKAEIIAILKAEDEAERNKIREELSKIEAIEGLSEIRDAIVEHNRYWEKFNYAVEHGTGILPAPPKTDVNDMMTKYPRAAAYLKANEYAKAANDAKAIAGKKARERIINGENYDKVIADMEDEWKSYCNKNIWD